MICNNEDCDFYDLGNCGMEEYPQFNCPEKEVKK